MYKKPGSEVAVKVRRMDGRAHLLLSKRRLQNRSTEGGIHTRSSDDGSSVLGEGVNGELQPLPIGLRCVTILDEACVKGIS